jgi:outer membrane protein, multidrug efflux system
MPKRSLLAAAAGLLLLALAGCASGPQPPAPGAVLDAGSLPRLQTAASAEVRPLSIERWWTVFGDPELDRRIEEALQRNHDLAFAAARLREARARLDEVRGARRPQLAVQVERGRGRQSADFAPPGSALTGGEHQAAVVGRFELDLWGRLAAASDAASERWRSQAWARAAVEWGLSAQIAESHFGLRALQRQIEIGDAVRASRLTTAQLRQREIAAGAVGEFDLRRAEAELASADATLAGLKRQRAALEHTLALLSGRPPAAIGDSETPVRPLDPAQRFVPLLPQGDAAALLLARPDVQQAEAELAAARFDIRAARAATLPSLSLTGSVGSDVRSLSNLFDGPGFVWSLALAASQTLFDGGQLASRVTQADARAEAAAAQYRKTVLGAVLELREAYAALDIGEQANTAQQQRVIALERARRIAAVGHARGALTSLDLLDAERNAFQAQLDEVGAYRDRLVGQVAAFKALGGGYAKPAIE